MKSGRNDPCPCGSGKKYKKCCLAKDEAEAMQRKLKKDRSLAAGAVATAAVSNNPESAPTTQDRAKFNDAAGQTDQPTEFMAETDDSAEEEEDPYYRDSGANHPRPKFILPKLIPEEQAIVDRWWSEMRPVYREMNAEVFLARILEFLDAQPRLFPHLYLHEECLFELAGALRRKGQNSQYIDLLKRLRTEQPQTFVACFGYFDSDIIEELSLTGRRAEIPAYFSYFKQYSDVDSDNCHKLTNWLAWLGYEDELMEIAKAVAIPCIESPHVLRGRFALDCLVVREYFPFFEARDTSIEAARKIQQAHLTLLPPGEESATATQILTVLQATAEMPQGWLSGKPPKDKGPYLKDLHWNFVGYLHREKGYPWVKAVYLATRLGEYFFREGKPQHPFALHEQDLEDHIARSYLSITCIDGALGLAFLQAVVHYIDYLAYSHAPTPQTRDQLMESCRALYPKVAAGIEVGDSSLRLYPSFEALSGP